MNEPSTVKDEVEFWRWREYNRVIEGKEWKSKDTITAGVDVGSVGSKAAIMVNGEAYSWGITRTGSNSPESATKVLGIALQGTGLKASDLKYIVGTGYGRVNVPMANKAITESPATQKVQTISGEPVCEPCLTLVDRTLKPYAATKQGESFPS